MVWLISSKFTIEHGVNFFVFPHKGPGSSHIEISPLEMHKAISAAHPLLPL